MSKAIRIKITKEGKEERQEFEHDPILLDSGSHTNFNIVARIQGMPKVSYKEALKRGLNYYWSGKQCKRGHLTYRSVKGSHCLKCYKYWHLYQGKKK